MNDQKKPLIIAIDDEKDLLDIIRNVAEINGFNCIIFDNGRDCKREWPDAKINLIIMDIVMPDMDGIEMLNWLAEIKCTTPVVLMSGFNQYMDSAKFLAQAKDVNILTELAKPFGIGELEVILKQISNPSPINKV